MASPVRRLRSISRPLPPASTGHEKTARAVGIEDDDLSEDLPPLDGVSGDEDQASALENTDDGGASTFDDPLDALDEDDPFDDKASEATEADTDDDANEAAGSSPER